MADAFDPKPLKVRHQWKHGAPLITVKFDPLGRYVFAAAEDRTVQRWKLPAPDADPKEAPPATACVGHESWVRDPAFTPDGASLISAGSDDRLIWWNVEAEQPEPQRTVEAHRGWIRALAVSPDGSLLASGGNDRVVKLWETASGKLVRELTGHAREIYSLTFDPTGKWLLSGDLLGEIKQWETASGKEERAFDAKALHSYNKGQQVDYGGVRSMAFTPDGKQLAAAGLHKASNPLGAVNEPIVLRFDWAEGKLLTSHEAAGVRGVAWRTVFMPTGELVACSGGSGGGLLLFWGSDAKAVHQLKLPDTARGMDLHPSLPHFATAHFDGNLRITF